MSRKYSACTYTHTHSYEKGYNGPLCANPRLIHFHISYSHFLLSRALAHGQNLCTLLMCGRNGQICTSFCAHSGGFSNTYVQRGYFLSDEDDLPYCAARWLCKSPDLRRFLHILFNPRERPPRRVCLTRLFVWSRFKQKCSTLMQLCSITSHAWI